MHTTQRCLVCRRHLVGRTDKRFCTDGCRNTWHNNMRPPASPAIRTTNRILHRNRTVLENVLPPGRIATRTPKKLLEAHGFQFGYCTAAQTRKNGLVLFFCYEYGYLPLNSEWCVIVKQGAG